MIRNKLVYLDPKCDGDFTREFNLNKCSQSAFFTTYAHARTNALEEEKKKAEKREEKVRPTMVLMSFSLPESGLSSCLFRISTSPYYV